MKKKIAAMALCGSLAGVPAWSQTAGPDSSQPPTMPSAATPTPAQPGGAGTARKLPPGSRIFSAGSALPEPARDEDIKPIAIDLPDDPLEPYLLTKGNGPFMVLAKVFRGPDSEKMALALCKELREEFKLPAYILRSKEWPMKSNIRGVPVQAPSMTSRAAIKQPEAVRTHDEAAVLVGDEQTLAGSEILLNKVKKLHPKCLEGMPSLFPWREGGGLGRALRTTNPYVPAQVLFPKTPDRLMVRMNSGLRSIANCPGRYTLQVAMFSGRTTYDLNSPDGQRPNSHWDLGSSPLKTAHDDAERLAEKLARAPEIRQLGQPVWVYHDRTSSSVFVGSFNSPNEPAVLATRNQLLQAYVALGDKRRGRSALDYARNERIVPATQLTDVKVMKASLN